MANEADGDVKKFSRYTYPTMQKIQGSFTLDIEAGEFTDSEILVRCVDSARGLAWHLTLDTLKMSAPGFHLVSLWAPLSIMPVSLLLLSSSVARLAW